MTFSSLTVTAYQQTYFPLEEKCSGTSSLTPAATGELRINGNVSETKSCSFIISTGTDNDIITLDFSYFWLENKGLHIYEYNSATETQGNLLEYYRGPKTNPGQVSGKGPLLLVAGPVYKFSFQSFTRIWSLWRVIYSRS